MSISEVCQFQASYVGSSPPSPQGYVASMAPLAKFGNFEWLSCYSPPPPNVIKKTTPAPAQPVTTVAPERLIEVKQMNRKINLWTQTPPGGLPPPPSYEVKAVHEKKADKEEKLADEVKAVDEEKAAVKSRVPAEKRESWHWKKFYCENPQLVKGDYDAEIWSEFSNFKEAEKEPVRSKFWRREFRRHPSRLSGDESDAEDDDSCFDSESDDDDSGSESSDSVLDSGYNSSYRRCWNARERKAALERNKKHDRKSSDRVQVIFHSDSSKHVHFSGGKSKLKGILKKKDCARSQEVESSAQKPVQEQRVQNRRTGVVHVNVNAFVFASRSQNSASEAKAAKQQQGKCTLQGNNNSSRQKQITTDEGGRADSQNHPSHNSHPRQTESSSTSRDRRQRQNHYFELKSNLNQFYHNLTRPINFGYHQFLNLDHIPHPFASPLTQSRSAHADFECATCPFCFSKINPEFQNFFNPFVGHFISAFPRKMDSTSAKSRCILPVQAQVMLVEHLLEIPTDPRPNAFYDGRTGMIRVYHGNVYGNPSGTLLPLHTEHMLSTLGAAMNVNGFRSFQSGFPVSGGQGFTDIQVARPAVPYAMPLPQAGMLPPMMPGIPMIDSRVASAMGQGYNPYSGGMNMGMANMNGMDVNMLANNMNNMHMNSSGEIGSPSYNNHRHGSGNYGGGNPNGGGEHRDNRNFSHISSNQNGTANGNHNGNASNSSGNKNNGNNRNQSRNPSRAGGNNNNRSSNSNSGNTNNSGGGGTWGNNNSANPFGGNNGTFDPAPAASASSFNPPPSPTRTANVTVANDAFFGGRVVDENITPTGETFAHIPGAFPDSPNKNDNNFSNDANKDNDIDAGPSNANNNWGNCGSNNNDEDNWGQFPSNNDVNFTRTDETVLSAGSWKSPSGQEENHKSSKYNGYNLKQVNNNSGNKGWGDPSAAQNTGGASQGW